MTEEFISVKVDTSQFDAMQARLLELAREHSIEEVSTFHGNTIKDLTSRGVDANGIQFHAYNPEYAIYGRLKQGFTLEPKDLQKTKGRLYQMMLDGNVLTLQDNDNARVIAAGQMSGAGGRWGYTHDFFDVSNETNEHAGDALAEYIEGHL